MVKGAFLAGVIRLEAVSGVALRQTGTEFSPCPSGRERIAFREKWAVHFGRR